MKVKHIITTCGIILGGLAITQGANAVVTYEGASDVQFTFSPSLSLALSGDGFVIDDLGPGMQKISNAVTATVSTNSSTGYTLSATVGNTTYNSTALISTNDTIAMMGSGTALTSGTWGYTVNDGTTYGALDTSTSTILNKTTNNAGAAAPGYSGTNTTSVKIGAYAGDAQAPGVYNNVVNFAATSNMATRRVTLASGTNVASVVLGGSGQTGLYTEGESVTIVATCTSGHNFSGWGKTVDYGTISNSSQSSTNYTVGASDIILTAYCEL